MPKILLVDDDVLNEELVTRFLSSENHEVVRAASGPEAVSFCSSERPDLILMDMALPNAGDGQKATRQIRALPGMQSVSIIALTGMCMPEEVAEMFRAGCNDIVTKPIERLHLLEKITTLLTTGTKT
jgi:CheY-like chemotaxis protein